MFNVRMSVKIGFSLALLVIVGALILILSVFSLRRLNGIVNQVATQSAPRVVVCSEIDSLLKEAELAQRNILLVEKLDERKAVAADLERIKGEMTRQLAELSRLLGDGQKAQSDSIRKAWEELAAVNDSIAAKALLNTGTRAKTFTLNESGQSFAACVAALDEAAAMLAKSSAFAAKPMLERANSLRARIYTLQGYEKDAVILTEQARVDDLAAKAKALIGEIDPDAEFFAKGQKLPSAIREKCGVFGGLYAKAKENCLATIALTVGNEDAKAYIEATGPGKAKGEAAIKLLDAVSKAAVDDFGAQTARSGEVYRSAMLWQVLISSVGLALSLVVAIFVIRGIVRRLSAAIQDLTDSSGRVTGAANAICGTSASLSQAAERQSAQLHDTSSMLGDMATTTRKNTESAQRTSQTTANTVKLVESGSVAVNDMSQAMAEINEQSEKISHIIKTIEEIAFQTNLLALNAAVEAARAGEAGKGFAVVADEVRNLAGRSAQAARDTSELIQGTVQKVHNGSDIAERLARSFKEIEEGTNEFKKLIQEVTESTEEQAHSVEQVNSNVGQLERSTRENAQLADESTSVSTDLTRQADNLFDVVNNLTVLVTGHPSSGAAPAAPACPAPGARKAAAPARAALPGRGAPKRGAPAAPEPAKVMRPDEVIPLDTDFGEF